MRAAAVRLREPGTVKAPAITGNGMAFARLPSKKGAMKHTDRTGAEQTAARQPEPTQEITVTQVTPDDILNDGGPITPAIGDGTPTERQLEQDVVMVNSSVDSMECRGYPGNMQAYPAAFAGCPSCSLQEDARPLAGAAGRMAQPERGYSTGRKGASASPVHR